MLTARTLIVIMLTLALTLPVNQTLNVKIVVYGSNGCYKCFKVKDFLEDILQCNVELYNIVQPRNAKSFTVILSMLNLTFMIPTVVVIVNGNVKAIVQGEVLNESFWVKMLNLRLKPSQIYVRGYNRNLNLIERIVEVDKVKLYNLMSAISHESYGIYTQPLIEVLTLALMDSINPCAIAFLALILMFAEAKLPIGYR